MSEKQGMLVGAFAAPFVLLLVFLLSGAHRELGLAGSVLALLGAALVGAGMGYMSGR